MYILPRVIFSTPASFATWYTYSIASSEKLLPIAKIFSSPSSAQFCFLLGSLGFGSSGVLLLVAELLGAVLSGTVEELSGAVLPVLLSGAEDDAPPSLSGTELILLPLVLGAVLVLLSPLLGAVLVPVLLDGTVLDGVVLGSVLVGEVLLTPTVLVPVSVLPAPQPTIKPRSIHNTIVKQSNLFFISISRIIFYEDSIP